MSTIRGIYDSLVMTQEEELKNKIHALKAEHAKTSSIDVEPVQRLRVILDQELRCLSSLLDADSKLHDQKCVLEKKIDESQKRIQDQTRHMRAAEDALIRESLKIKQIKDEVLKLKDMMTTQYSSTLSGQFGYRLVIDINAALREIGFSDNKSNIVTDPIKVTPSNIQKQILEFLDIDHKIEEAMKSDHNPYD